MQQHLAGPDLGWVPGHLRDGVEERPGPCPACMLLLPVDGRRTTQALHLVLTNHPVLRIPTERGRASMGRLDSPLNPRHSAPPAFSASWCSGTRRAWCSLPCVLLVSTGPRVPRHVPGSTLRRHRMLQDVRAPHSTMENPRNSVNSRVTCTMESAASSLAVSGTGHHAPDWRGRRADGRCKARSGHIQATPGHPLCLGAK